MALLFSGFLGITAHVYNASRPTQGCCCVSSCETRAPRSLKGPSSAFCEVSVCVAAVRAVGSTSTPHTQLHSHPPNRFPSSPGSRAFCPSRCEVASAQQAVCVRRGFTSEVPVSRSEQWAPFARWFFHWWFITSTSGALEPGYRAALEIHSCSPSLSSSEAGGSGPFLSDEGDVFPCLSPSSKAGSVSWMWQELCHRQGPGVSPLWHWYMVPPVPPVLSGCGAHALAAAEVGARH